MNDGVVFLPSYYEAIKDLPDGERLQMYDTIVQYGLYDTEPEGLNPTMKSMFTLIKPVIDSSQRRHRASKENGKKGGAPKGNQNARKQPKNNQTNNQTNNHDLDNDLDTDMDNDSDSEKADKPQRTRFIPPTVAEVEAYCQERNNGLDAQRFVDFYTANGWKVGKNTMKDWKAAVRTWENRDQDKKQIDNDWMKEKVVGWNGNR